MQRTHKRPHKDEFSNSIRNIIPWATDKMCKEMEILLYRRLEKKFHKRRMKEVYIEESNGLGFID